MNEEELDWTDEPIIGQALIIMGMPNKEPVIDSSGQLVKSLSYYRVGKHKTNGKVAIIEI
jgi:hypothetical protein